MRKIFLSLFILALFNCNPQSDSNTIEAAGKKSETGKWQNLEKYLLTKRIFYTPPSGEIHFESNQRLYFVTRGLDASKTKGSWKIDAIKGSIAIKVPGTINDKYKNYYIDCWEKNNRKKCQLILLKDIKIPKDIEEIYDNSSNYILTPKDD